MNEQQCTIDGEHWPTQRDAAIALRELRASGHEAREGIVAIVQAYGDLLGATSKRRNRIVSEIREATRPRSETERQKQYN